MIYAGLTLIYFIGFFYSVYISDLSQCEFRSPYLYSYPSVALMYVFYFLSQCTYSAQYLYKRLYENC